MGGPDMAPQTLQRSGRPGEAVAPSITGGSLLVLERHVDAGAKRRHLPLVDRDVEARYLGHAQVAKALARGGHGVLDRVFPRHLAGSDQIGHTVDAVAGHGAPPRGPCHMMGSIGVGSGRWASMASAASRQRSSR